jgi:hypothetical protein
VKLARPDATYEGLFLQATVLTEVRTRALAKTFFAKRCSDPFTPTWSDSTATSKAIALANRQPSNGLSLPEFLCSRSRSVGCLCAIAAQTGTVGHRGTV